MADYQELRQRHVAYLASIFPQWVQRLRWPAERLRQERQERLRELLRVALASSPWHRERLAGVDPEAFTEEDLPGLPAMTKGDLMANWDGIVSDRRLTLDLAERHLAGLTSDAYLFDELHVIASGGSTGRRGVYAHGLRAWAEQYAGFMRPVLWDRAASPEVAALPSTVAMVAAQHATHMTSAMGQTFANPSIQVERFPVTLPLERIVAGLNAYRPVAVLGYPSALALLAAEAREGGCGSRPGGSSAPASRSCPRCGGRSRRPSARRSPTCTEPPRPGRSGSAAGGARACTCATTW
jgi:phenylacetate-coenzyme A ligase PaaK-like adenylate-forming protein